MTESQTLNMEDLLERISLAFEESAIKNKAEKEGAQWFYSICTNKPRKNQVLLLGLNWGADPDGHKPQDYSSLVEELNWNMLGSLAGIEPFFKSYFAKYSESTMLNQSNLCFFRSKRESDLELSDIEMCRNIFNEFIVRIQPPLILGFSAKLRDYLRNQVGIKSESSRNQKGGKAGVKILWP